MKKPDPKKPPARGITPTQMRLGDDVKDQIERIRKHFGLPSMAAAIRYAVEQTANSLPVVQPKARMSRKGVAE